MYGAALILGLAGSLHCLGMCGPIALAVPAGRGGPGSRAAAYATYHFGRIGAYALLGFLFGTLGYGLSMTDFQEGLSIVAGVVMLAVIWLPRSGIIGRADSSIFALQGRVQRFMAARLRDHRFSAVLGIGFFNGFLPCGMVYIALTGAIAAGHPASGALFMTFFGLGTAPALFLLAFGMSAVSPERRYALLKLAPYVASVIAVLFIIRGLGLGIPFLSPEAGFIVSPDQHCAP